MIIGTALWITAIVLNGDEIEEKLGINKILFYAIVAAFIIADIQFVKCKNLKYVCASYED